MQQMSWEQCKARSVVIEHWNHPAPLLPLLLLLYALFVTKKVMQLL